MRQKIIIISTLLLLFSALKNSYSQESFISVSDNNIFKQAKELFEKEKFGSAQKLFQEVINSKTETFSHVKTDAEYYRAICAIELFHKDSEYLLKKFVEEHPEHPKVKYACFQMGKINYRHKRYSKAVKWFWKVDKFEFEDEELIEFYFKLGYSYFQTEELDSARLCFFEIKNDTSSEYSSPSTYYYAHIAYQQKNYQTALNHFNNLSDDSLFAAIVPYYITQIYYYKDDYEKIVDYAPDLLDNATPTRSSEIARIIGEAYFKLKDYKNAEPYLEKFKENEKSISREDKYLLAFVYYSNGKFEEASKLFKKVANGKDKFAQNSSFHLADCYIKLNDKTKAKAAFSEASKMDFDKNMAENALFNYAKLTYELSYSPFNETINTFEKFIEKYPESENIDLAYDFLVKVYTTSKNYKAALNSIEKISNKNQKIKEAYQRISYYRALELFTNLKYLAAINHFNKSLEYKKFNKQIKALSYFWKAEAFYRLKKYDDAIECYNNFLSTTGAFELKEYISANYSLGYCYFKLKDYPKSISWFRKYVNKNENISKTTGDAYNRIGDCYFVSKDYSNAIKYYDLAITINTIDVDYSLFNKAFSYGLLKKHSKKIKILENILTDFPQSQYTDDAIFEIGKSYVKIDSIQKAIEKFDAIIANHPTSSYIKKALLQLGLLHYNANQNSQALVAYKKIVEDYKGSAESKNALIGIKNIYIDEHQEDKYFEYVAQLGDFANISISEQDSLSYLSAENLYMSGNCKDSKGKFTKYISKYPDGNYLLNSHFFKADCNYQNDEFEEALSSYNYVIIQPKNSYTEEALLKAARINFYFKNFENAVQNCQSLEQIAENNTNLLEARIGQMRGFFKLNNDSNAIFAANRVLISDKVSDEIIREAHYILAKSFFSQNDYQSAVPELKIVASNVNTKEGAEAKYLLSEILFLQKQYELAEKEIIDFNNKNTPYYFWQAKAILLLSDIYINKDDIFMAKHSLQSIIEAYDVPNDGIIDEAQVKLNEIEENEEIDEILEENLDIEIDFDDNSEKNYNELFEPEKNEIDSITQKEMDRIFNETFETEKDSTKNN
ncbi:MAG: tetratricopeptide repeat protein [Bacteroidetes bacterium]|jgi:TolA-binding protein|nr:tetratricopeptide repeat protein [Bacteroidota bacterium]MBT6685559.1 tetratricopeptide repeat protein [Bacteroidota bacterium]MBT7493122.1 tetratricopeptide repeat protein [Bacteroidota bacterium]